MSLAAPMTSTDITSHEGDAAPAAPQMTFQPASTATADQTPESGSDEIVFVRPIPGFATLRRWLLTPFDGEDSSLWELVSIERPEIRFMVAAACGFFPHYDIELADDVCEDLTLDDAGDALILVVLTVGRGDAAITANLLAPVVINARTRRAAQVILSGSEWPVREPLG